jgi:hypothetical protein
LRKDFKEDTSKRSGTREVSGLLIPLRLPRPRVQILHAK